MKKLLLPPKIKKDPREVQIGLWLKKKDKDNFYKKCDDLEIAPLDTIRLWIKTFVSE